MNKKLESFKIVSPYINDLTNSDFAVSVCDLEKCLCYVSGSKIDHKIREGTSHVKGSASYRCIQEKKKIVQIIDKEVFGFPYVAIALPIYEEDDIIGTVCFTENLDKQESLFNKANTLYSSMTEMTSSADVISSNTSSLKNICDKLELVFKSSMKKVEATDEILGYINKISKQINLLGLNASIEASRYSGSGKGFRVVADEIRKLATSTSDYIKKVDTILCDLKDTTKEIESKVNELTEISSNQIEFMKDIYESIDSVNNVARELKEETKYF